MGDNILMHKVRSLIFALAPLGLIGCSSGVANNSASSNLPTIQQAQVTYNVSSNAADGLFSSDHPLSPEEIYALRPGAIEAEFAGSSNPQVTKLLDTMRNSSAAKLDLNPQSVQSYATGLDTASLSGGNSLSSQTSTYLYCYATGWVTVNGTKLPLGGPKADALNPASYHLNSWALSNLKTYAPTFKIQYPITPFTQNTAHLVYYIKDTSYQALKQQCAKTFEMIAAQYLQAYYQTSSMADVTLNNITIRGRNNSLSYDHPLLPLNAPTPADKIDTIVAFGDSLSDTDATNNFTQWQVPSRDTWFAGHFSDGWTWVEYAAESLNVIPYNEAWGGAGVEPVPLVSWIPNWFEYFHLYLPSLMQETGYFNQRVSTLAPRDPNKTLYTILIGGNDFNRNEAVNSVINGVATTVQNLIVENGAKNIIVLNLPDISVAPIFQPGHSRSFMRASVQASVGGYDQQLISLISSLNQIYAANQANITLFDTTNVFNQIMNNPASFGLINTTTTCLANPDNDNYMGNSKMTADCNGSNYFFWDQLHPTTRIHQILGTAVAQFAQQHYNF
jgi:phospholipase/lecithinase/hemolysin